MNTKSTNIPVRIHISDPWDLGESLNWEPLEGKVIAVNGSDILEKALIKLNEMFEYTNTKCEYFIASHRHEGTNIEYIFEGKPLMCGLIRVPKELVESSNPFDLSAWRGGIAIIAEVEPI